MPHQFQAINCKKCSHHYCPVCERTCPISDDNTMVTRSAMRLHMKKHKEDNSEKI